MENVYTKSGALARRIYFGATLIWESAENNNLIVSPYSEAFDDAYWIKSSANNEISVLENQITAPDSTNAADFIFSPETISGVHSLYESITEIVAGETYTFSVFAKAGTGSVIQLFARSATFGMEVYANFDLSNKTIGRKGTATTAKMIEISNSPGWYRCIIIATAIANGIGSYALGLVNSIANNPRQATYIGDGKGVYVWGSKLEVGNKETDLFTENSQYYSTSSFPEVNSQYKLNLITDRDWTSSYWTKLNTTVISGGVNNPNGNIADVYTVTEDSTTSSKYVFEGSVDIPAGNKYEFIIYAKAGTSNFIQLEGRSNPFGVKIYANFDLSNGTMTKKGTTTTRAEIYNEGGGWYKCVIEGVSIAYAVGGYSIAMINSGTAARGFSYLGTNKTVFCWKPLINKAAFVQFGFGSDLHYGLISNYAGRYPQAGDEKLTDAITVWNSKSLGFVHMNGDFVDAGHIQYTPERNESEALTDLQLIEGVFQTATAPRKYAFGNHDLDKMSKATFIANTAMVDKYHFFDQNGIRFIVLDATFLSDNDTNDFDTGNFDPDNHLTDFVPPNERTWLTNTLASATGKVVVFCHQSLHSNTNDLSVNNAAAVRTILDNSNKVTAVLTGHEHINLKTILNGIPYYSMDAMTKGAYPANAYAIVRVYEGKIEIDGFGNQSNYNLTEL